MILGAISVVAGAALTVWPSPTPDEIRYIAGGAVLVGRAATIGVRLRTPEWIRPWEPARGHPSPQPNIEP